MGAVPICGSNDVLVGDGTDESVGVEPPTPASGTNVGTMKGGGVSVGNSLRRYFLQGQSNRGPGAIGILHLRFTGWTARSVPECKQQDNKET